MCYVFVFLSIWGKTLEIISHHPCVEHLAQETLISVRALYTPAAQLRNGVREATHTLNTAQTRQRAALVILLLKGPALGATKFGESLPAAFMGLESRSSVMGKNVWSSACMKITLCRVLKPEHFHVTQVVFSRTCDLAKRRPTQCNHVCLFSTLWVMFSPP